MTTLPRLLRFHAWETEQALQIMYSKGKETGHNIETFVIVVDAAGLKMKLATGDAFAFIKGMASTDSDHYPERLGMLLVINAPSMLSAAWKVVKGFLDDVTKSKIKIFAKASEWQPALFAAVDRDQVPVMYGGTAPNPDVDLIMRSISSPMNRESLDDSIPADFPVDSNDDVTDTQDVDFTTVDESNGETSASSAFNFDKIDENITAIADADAVDGSTAT